jgi:dihydrofolate reductase
MRKVIFSLGLTLDGYIARLDGSVDFLFMPKGYSMAPFLKTVDTVIMGRKTYEVAKAMGGGFDRKVGYYVVSRSLPPGKRDGVTFTADSPADLIAKVRKEQGKDIWLMGGGELTRDFLRAGLIDEVHLGIVPVLLGEGIPAFPAGFPQCEFNLLENKAYAQGFVSLKYERRRDKAQKSSR